MNLIEIILDGVPDSDARSALYYASRYIKQADYFEEYGKDIFDDEDRSAPSKIVKTIALKIISAIEAREGCSAAKFADRVVIRILNEITEIENNLGPELTEDQIISVTNFTNSLKSPK